MGEFRMPTLGASMEAGTLVEWLRQPGDSVKRGDIIAVVDTEKGAIEIEVFEDGVLRELRVPVGEKVPVGTVLAVIDAERPGGQAPPAKSVAAGVAPTISPGTPGPPTAPPSERQGEQGRPPKSVGAGSAPTISPVAPVPPAARSIRSSPAGPDAGETSRSSSVGAEPASAISPGAPVHAGARAVRSSPAARKAATALGVDLSTVVGSGPGGAISLADVERSAQMRPPEGAVSPPAAASAPPASVAATPTAESRATAAPSDPALRMRQAIAAAMSRSKREIPHFYLAATVDMSRALTWVTAENLKRSVTERLLPAVLLIKAVALALREVPEMNGFWTNGAFVRGAAIHPGIAVSLRGGGLVAPALLNADQKDLTTLMTALRDLVARARSGGLRGSEVSEQTITITNLGEQGVEVSYGIIYPPQVALVSFGKIVERPVVVEGEVRARPVVHVSVSVDHRAVDGHAAGRFLAAVDRLFQTPEQL